MKIGSFEVGLDRPFFLIAGPCVIESRELAMETAGRLKEIAGRVGGATRAAVFCGSSMGGWFARIMQLRAAAAAPGLSTAAVAFNPADPSNYTPGGIVSHDYVVVHTMQGYYLGAQSWFQNPDANVSAHFCMRSEDGEVTRKAELKEFQRRYKRKRQTSAKGKGGDEAAGSNVEKLVTIAWMVAVAAVIVTLLAVFVQVLAD